MEMLFEETPVGNPESSIRPPVLDDGMVALIRWIEGSPLSTIDGPGLHLQCRKIIRERFSTQVYNLTIGPPKITLEINLRDNPGKGDGSKMLSAAVVGPGWSLTRTQLLLWRNKIPSAIQQILVGDIQATKAREIVDHPYMVGAWTKRSEMKEKEIILTLQRGTPRHILTPNGVEPI